MLLGFPGENERPFFFLGRGMNGHWWTTSRLLVHLSLGIIITTSYTVTIAMYQVDDESPTAEGT